MSDVNWSSVLDEVEKDPGFKPLDAGTYSCIVEDCEAVIAGTGAKMLKVTLKVLVGPREGAKVFTNIVFATSNPKAMKFTLRKLAALGVDTEMLRTKNPTTAQIAGMVKGVKTDVEVTQRDDETWGIQNDVKSFKSAGSGVGPKAAPSIGPKAGVPKIPAAPVVETPEEPADSVEPEPETGDPF